MYILPVKCFSGSSVYHWNTPFATCLTLLQDFLMILLSSALTVCANKKVYDGHLGISDDDNNFCARILWRSIFEEMSSSTCWTLLLYELFPGVAIICQEYLQPCTMQIFMKYHHLLNCKLWFCQAKILKAATEYSVYILIGKTKTTLPISVNIVFRLW